MTKVTNGMTARAVTWRKSSYSNADGNCVELATLASGLIAVRDSWDPDGPAQIYPRAVMVAFVHAVKSGELDQRVR